MGSRRIDWTDDAGQLAGIEAIPFGLLVFVVGTLLVAQAWAVVDVKLTVDAAAREAVRTFVEAPDEPTALAAGRAAADDAVRGHGRDPAKLTIDPPVYAGVAFTRCTPVSITARYPVPAVTLPWIGGVGEGLTATATHSEVVDPYRSGLAAGGGC